MSAERIPNLKSHQLPQRGATKVAKTDKVIEADNVQPQPPQGRGEHPTLTSDTARQGPAGVRVLAVLGVSVIGAAVILAAIYAYFLH
jgi:hypothetical protein